MKKRKAARKKTGRERRKYRRYPINLRLNYCILKLPAAEKMVKLLAAIRRGKGKDVSSGGICFDTSHILVPGTILRIEIPNAPRLRGQPQRAKVVWTRETRPNEFRVGIRFI